MHSSSGAQALGTPDLTGSACAFADGRFSCRKAGKAPVCACAPENKRFRTRKIRFSVAAPYGEVGDGRAVARRWSRSCQRRLQNRRQRRRRRWRSASWQQPRKRPSNERRSRRRLQIDHNKSKPQAKIASHDYLVTDHLNRMIV